MANPTPKTDTKSLAKRILPNLKIGLHANESLGSGNYTAHNKDTNALGKYQFVAKYHWEPIKSYAKKNGYGDLTSYSQFLNNKELQEAYFEEVWIPETVVPKAVELHKKYGAKYNLSLEEIAALVHFRGPASGNNSAEDVLKNNKLGKRIEGNNKTAMEFVNTYRNAVPSPNQFKYNVEIDTKKATEAYKNYKDQYNKILKSDISQERKVLKLDELQREIYHNGYMDIFNETIKLENIANQNLLKAKKNHVIKSVDLINYLNENSNINNVWGDKNVPHDFGKRERIFDPEAVKKFEELAKNPAYKDAIKVGNDPADRVINGRHVHNARYVEVYKPKFFESLQKEANSMLPEDQKLNLIKVVNGKIHKGEDYRAIGDSKIPFGDMGTVPGVALTVLGSKFRSNTGSFLKIDTEWQNNLDPSYLSEEYTIPEIRVNPEWLTQAEIESQEESENSSGSSGDSSSSSNSSTSNDDYVGPTDAQREILARNDIPVETGHELSDAFFDASMFEMNDVDGRGATRQDYEMGDIPYMELGSSLLGIVMGAKGADEELPLRDEMINEGMYQYVGELRKISEQGLSPEEEAYAKNKLKESYSIGLDNLVRASNGNRSIVLGNASRLDAQMQQSLMDLSLADFEKRERAFYQYGEAVKYINDIDLNKQIENNQRLYQNAVATKEAGAELMANGISSLLENIQYYKENAPGSVNHALKSLYKKQAFGFDDSIIDPNGEIEGSLEHFQKQKEKNKALYAERKDYSSRYASLSVDDKKKMNQYLKETNYNWDMAKGYLESLISGEQTNPETALSTVPGYSDNMEGVITLTNEELNNPNEHLNLDHFTNPNNYNQKPSKYDPMKPNSYNPMKSNYNPFNYVGYGNAQKMLPSVQNVSKDPFSKFNYKGFLQEQQLDELVRNFNMNANINKL